MDILVLAAAVTAQVMPVQTPPHDCLARPTPTAAHKAPAKFEKLGDLPDANQVRLVLRTVDGCAYQEITRFKVSSPGPYYAEGVLAPVGGGIEPAKPTSDGR